MSKITFFKTWKMMKKTPFLRFNFLQKPKISKTRFFTFFLALFSRVESTHRLCISIHSTFWPDPPKRGQKPGFHFASWKKPSFLAIFGHFEKVDSPRRHFFAKKRKKSTKTLVSLYQGFDRFFDIFDQKTSHRTLHFFKIPKNGQKWRFFDPIRRPPKWPHFWPFSRVPNPLVHCWWKSPFWRFWQKVVKKWSFLEINAPQKSLFGEGFFWGVHFLTPFFHKITKIVIFINSASSIFLCKLSVWI